jgi:hypothetical protein
MKLKTFFTIHALMAWGFGIGFMLLPGILAELLGHPAGFDETHGWRYFGVAFFMIGILVWAARDSEDSVARRAILWMAVIGYPIMTIYHFISLFVLGIPFTLMMGSVIALHVTFAIIYALYLRKDLQKK